MTFKSKKKYINDLLIIEIYYTFMIINITTHQLVRLLDRLYQIIFYFLSKSYQISILHRSQVINRFKGKILNHISFLIYLIIINWFLKDLNVTKKNT